VAAFFLSVDQANGKYSISSVPTTINFDDADVHSKSSQSFLTLIHMDCRIQHFGSSFHASDRVIP